MRAKKPLLNFFSSDAQEIEDKADPEQEESVEEAEELAKSSSETSSLSGSDSNDDSDDSSSSNETSDSSSQSSDSESSYSGDSDSSGSEAGSRTTSPSVAESGDVLSLSANDKIEEGVEMEKITPYRRSGSGLITYTKSYSVSFLLMKKVRSSYKKILLKKVFSDF